MENNKDQNAPAKTGASFDVWVGDESKMSSIIKKCDELIVCYHVKDNPANKWNLFMPPETANSGKLLMLLAAIHDQCAAHNLVGKRTWSLNDGPPLKAPAPTSIPVSSPEQAKAMIEALSGKSFPVRMINSGNKDK
jgi:hypothetical protein